MAFKTANNVSLTLQASVSIGATTLVLNAESGVNAQPPDPGGGTAALTLVDDLAAPSKLEIIYYTSVSGAGPYTLTGVLKGREGTADQAWDANDLCFQAETAELSNKIAQNPATLPESFKVDDNTNMILAGPVAVSSGKTLTVGLNATLVIL